MSIILVFQSFGGGSWLPFPNYTDADISSDDGIWTQRVTPNGKATENVQYNIPISMPFIPLYHSEIKHPDLLQLPHPRYYLDYDWDRHLHKQNLDNPRKV